MYVWVTRERNGSEESKEMRRVNKLMKIAGIGSSAINRSRKHHRDFPRWLLRINQIAVVNAQYTNVLRIDWSLEIGAKPQYRCTRWSINLMLIRSIFIYPEENDVTTQLQVYVRTHVRTSLDTWINDAFYR